MWKFSDFTGGIHTDLRILPVDFTSGIQGEAFVDLRWCRRRPRRIQGAHVYSNIARYCPHVSADGTSRTSLGYLNTQVVDLKKLEYWNIKVQVSCRSEQTCRTSCSSTGRMLRHGGAPIWTALTVKTGEITGISFPTGKVGPGPIRTLKE